MRSSCIRSLAVAAGVVPLATVAPAATIKPPTPDAQVSGGAGSALTVDLAGMRPADGGGYELVCQ